MTAVHVPIPFTFSSNHRTITVRVAESKKLQSNMDPKTSNSGKLVNKFEDVPWVTLGPESGADGGSGKAVRS